jgi:hypothetical protein
MPNKHQKRIRDEGVSKRRTERRTVTVDPVTEAITVEDGAVQLVRISQAMYDTLPVDGQSFLGHNYRVALQAAPAVYTIGQIRVPDGLVLDISELRFHIMSGNGIATVVQGDLNMHNQGVCRVRIGGINPWDQFTFDSAASAPREGWDVLNQNIMESWSDIPVHLIAQEGQLVEMLYEVVQAAYFNAVIGGGNAVIDAHIRGRWIPIQAWRDMIWKNRGGGEVE